MYKPREIFDTHHSSGPTWHYAPGNEYHGRSLRGRRVTRRGNPKLYYTLMCAIIAGAAYVFTRAIFELL